MANENDGKIKVFFQKNGSTLAIVAVAAIIVIIVVYFLNGSGNMQYGEDDLYAPNAQTMISPQPSAASVPSGTILYCFRLNGSEGMHVPALIPQAQNVFDNGGGGVNWGEKMTADGSEPHGILPDGTFFVKKSYLERWNPSSVDLKTSIIGWDLPVKMTEGEINDEPAYIYHSE